jgi:hypothetical protein
MGQNNRLVKPVVKPELQLQQFLETCSDQSLGDLLLAKLNSSANANGDFQAAIQTLLQHVLKIVEMADTWAQKEAEQRYVNFVREAARQRREAIEVTSSDSALIVTRSEP